MVTAFAAHLEQQGWEVRLEVDHCDLVATRPGETLYAEAKGRTTAIGLDVDTLFGQLLRRMKPVKSAGDQYAVVVPLEAGAAVRRVPERVRSALGIRVFLVSPDNTVHELDSSTSTP